MRAVYTTDGRTWRAGRVPSDMPTTIHPFGFNLQSHPSLAYAGGRFLAFGFYRSSSGNGTAVWSSPDGLRWTRTSFLRSQPWSTPDEPRNLVRFGSGWIAAGIAGMAAGDECHAAIWQSSDLVHWSRPNVPEAPWPGTCDEPLGIAASGSDVVIGGYGFATDYNSPSIRAGRLIK
jgi:hypothetical protein